MGAIAPISHWIPEDDLSLKNAVEAGASLESLAKGAVRFSRKFTVRELQDRWYSLLYDPDISDEASARMVEFELSASNISSKFNRFGNSVGSEQLPVKRKVESVRRHYYAMRKRICSAPCNSIDLSFHVAPSVHNCIGNGCGCQEQSTLNKEPPVGNCMLEDPTSNHFELQEIDFDLLLSFPQIMRDATDASTIGDIAHAFHAGHVDSLEDDLPQGIMDRDCLYGFTENVSPLSVKESVGNVIGHSSEHNNVLTDISHTFRENISGLVNFSSFEEMGPPELPVDNLFELDDSEATPLSTFDSVNSNPENVCSGFGVNQGFNSPVSDCSASFHQMGYSSPLPTIPIWRTIEDIPAPTMPIDVSLGDKDQGARDTLALPDDDDAKKIRLSGYDVHSEPLFKVRLLGSGLNSSTAISESDLEALANSLLDFTNEEQLHFMDVDGKDVIDRSCLDGLNSLLMSSPTDVHQDDIPTTTEAKISEALGTYLPILGGACPGELDDIVDPLHSGHGDACCSEVNVPSSTSAPNPHFPELRNGTIFCTLNTDDPEIPCNDDVFFPTQVPHSFVSHLTQPNFEEANISASSSAKDFSDNQKAIERELSLMKEGENPAQPPVASQMIGSQALREMGPNLPVGGCGVKSEFPECDSLAVISRHAGTARGECRSAHVTPNSVPAGVLKEDFTEVELGKDHDFDNSIDSFLEKPLHGSDHIKHYPQNSAGGCRQEQGAPPTIQKQWSFHAEPGSVEMDFPKPRVNPSTSTSDQEEQLSESDDDIPSFSDIEAMVLDMDLGPDDQDSNFSRKVSSCQYEDTKREIIRLEQGAHSYMQRTIASHGAFAILYGRHLKHYIKETEVLLGRASYGVNVDIDLRREGRAKQISRRQAIIKLDEDGSFYLKNLGLCSILVNSKKVATGQCLCLSSSCLIEIKNMRFVFETNQNSVRQYVANIAEKRRQEYQA